MLFIPLQVIKMLVAIIVLFTLCWGPTLVDNVLVAFEVLDKLHYGYLKHIRMAFVLMSYANSCVNPIVYAFMSRNFRESFKYALCSCLHGKAYLRRTHYRRQTSFRTKETSIASAGRLNSAVRSDVNSVRYNKYCHLPQHAQQNGQPVLSYTPEEIAVIDPAYQWWLSAVHEDGRVKDWTPHY